MRPIHMAELERVAALARTIITPLAESLSRSARVTVRIESPEAERTSPTGIATGLEGQHWVLPVEVSGVHNGILCLLIPQSLQEPGEGKSGESFLSMADEFLSSASDRLTAALGGPVSLDRLGLRETSSDSVEGALIESLGPGDLVAVHFAAGAPAARGGDERTADLVVVFGGRLLRELVVSTPASGETIARPDTPSSPAKLPVRDSTDLTALLARAKGLRVSLSVELGRTAMALGELARLRPGGTIELDKAVTQPLELWVGARRISSVDAVVVGGRLGVRLRGGG